MNKVYKKYNRMFKRVKKPKKQKKLKKNEERNKSQIFHYMVCKMKKWMNIMVWKIIIYKGILQIIQNRNIWEKWVLLLKMGI